MRQQDEIKRMQQLAGIPINEGIFDKLDQFVKDVNTVGARLYKDKPLLPSALKAYQNNWDTNKAKGISWERWSTAVKDKFGISDKDLQQIKK